MSATPWIAAISVLVYCLNPAAQTVMHEAFALVRGVACPIGACADAAGPAIARALRQAGEVSLASAVNWAALAGAAVIARTALADD